MRRTKRDKSSRPSSKPVAARRFRFQPQVESLEDRLLLSVIDHSGGFAAHGDLQINLRPGNGGASFTGTIARLTDGGNDEQNSIFTTSAVDISQFHTYFDFNQHGGGADGMTFVIQGVGPSALAYGLGGGGLGYGADNRGGATGITKSVAVKFDLYNNQGEGDSSTGIFSDGRSPTVGDCCGDQSISTYPSNLNLHSGDTFRATLDYNGTTLTENLQDRTTGVAATFTYSVNIAAHVGSSMAYLGFTAATGGSTATQDVNDWYFNSDNPIKLSGQADQTAVEQAGQSFNLGSFTDSSSGGTHNVAVAWGDGMSSSFSVPAPGSLGSLTHTYAEEGTKVVTITVTNAGNASATGTFRVTASDPAVRPTGGFTLTGTEGADSGMQTVATFTDPAGAETAADYSASIAWGDGSTSAGTVSGPNAGVFTVQGSHKYAEEGNFTVTTTVSHDTAPTATAMSSARVGDAAVLATGGYSVTVNSNGDTGVQTVATFRDPAGAEALTDYSASINWGDGGTASAGTVSYSAGTGVFTVQGSHHYQTVASDLITVTIHHDTASDATTTSRLTPSPDLRVANLALTFPGARQSGASVTVGWDDANQGTAAVTGAFYDTVVVTNTGSGKTIAQVSALYDPSVSGNGPIAANDHHSRQAIVRLPDGTDSVGTLSFTVTTDAFNQISETDHSHNTAGVTAAVTLAPYPDLQVNNLRTTPATGLQSGSSLVIAWDDANPGSGATPAGWSDSLTVVNRTTGQTLLTTNVPYDATASGAIPAGGSKSRQLAFTLPDGNAGAGTIAITVTADASASFFEYHAGGPNPNKTATITPAATLAPYPDLTVTNVQAPATALAGRSVSLSWTVANQGTAATQGSWTDQVFLSPDQHTDDGLLVASFTYSGPLAVNGIVTRSEMILVPATGLAGNYSFYVRTNATGTLFESNTNNNTLLATQVTAVPASLTLALGVTAVAKDAGTFTATVSRNGSLTAALPVSLASGNTGKLTVPATVTIPAGLASTSFTVTVVQDGLADGNQSVSVTASATGLQSDMHSVTVIDINKPTLTVTLAAAQVKEGDPSPATTGTVTRNMPTTQPLVVTLATDDPVRVILPATVTIAAGQTSATFPVDARRDFVIEGPQTEHVQATAANFVSASAPLLVVDADAPTLGLSLAATSVLKNTVNPATSGTVTRGAAATSDLIVQLVSGDTGKVLVPTYLVIPAGQVSATFPINVLDNHLADGTQTVTITAYVTTTNGNVQLTQGSAAARLNLLDYHQPSLQMALARDLTGENSTLSATVSRAQATAQALTVNLASDNTAEATVPATVTIPANQTSVTFSVTALRKAAQPVTITATATGFNNGAAQLVVTDQALPDLKVTNITAPASALTQDQVTVNFRVDNLGLATAFGSWTDQVYLSPTGLAKDGTLLGTIPFTADPTNGLPVNLFYQKGLPFSMPNVPGDYWVIVTTNAGHTLTEGLQSNDTTVSAQPIHVTPAYTATVASAVRTGIAGQPVLLRGSATKAGSSAPAAFVTVTVRVQLRGTRRVLTALTDANGNFSVVFQPLPGEGGAYQIGAAHPAVLTDPIQDQFTLLGMRADPNQPAVVLQAGGSATGALTLQNLSDVALSGIAATVQGLPADLAAQVNVGNSLPGSGTLPVTFTVRSLDNVGLQGTAVIHFTSTQGATLDVPLQVTVNRLVPNLTANPAALTAGVLRGGQNVVSVTVINQGGAASGDLNVVLPALSWLHLATPAVVPSLDPGQATRVDLVLLPPVDINLGAYNGVFALSNAATSLNIPFTFNALSNATGNVTVTAVDEYTFYAAGSPKLAGAHVTLTDALTGTVTTQGTTDASGQFVAQQVREGYYILDVQADRHFGYHQTILVSAGSNNPVQTFLARQTVQYSWTVVPTQVQDQTTVKIQTTFETNVPVPVITVDPPSIDLTTMQPGETRQINLTVSNHGLIAANDAKLHLPSDPRYRVTALITDLGAVPAMSSLTVPVIIQRVAGTGPGAQDGGTCSFSFDLSWTLVCGDQTFTYGLPITVIVSFNCGGGSTFDPGGGVIQTSGGPSSGGSSTFVYQAGYANNTDQPCDPCSLLIAQAVLKEGFNDLVGRVFGDVAAVANDLYNLFGSVQVQVQKSEPDVPGTLIGAGSTVVDILKASGKEIPYVGEALEVLDLANEIRKILKECQGGGGGAGPGAQDGGVAVDIIPPDVLALLNKEADRLQTMLNDFSDFFGDEVWLRATQSAPFQDWITAFLARVTDANGKAKAVSTDDRNQLLQMALPAPLTAADVNKFLDRWNRTLDYWGRHIFNLTQVPMGQSTDFMAVDDLLAQATAGVATLRASAADGYPLVLDGLEQAVEGVYQSVTTKSGGTCARVRLNIDQQAVLTRDAFDATLQIANNTDAALTNIKVDVHVYDGQGRDMTSLFSLRPPQLTNLSAVDGTGQILGGITGQASWIILPGLDAAPSQPTQYFVGATLSYTDMGVPVVVPMGRTAITVYPQAQLTLKYFFQRDVFGPDPSDPSAPSEPFSLGVLVSNTGKGTAQNVSITSAQPQIVDNQKGLLVNFTTLGTEVNGRSLNPGLTADFGNINPGQTAVGRWLFTSSLEGFFKAFQASFQHTDALGGQQFSLIQSVEIHELIHVVHMTMSGLPDFLVDDRPSSLHLPDTLYFGDGTVAPVTASVQGSVDAPVSASHLQVHLTASLAAGYGYLQIADPGAGNFHLVRVVRSDGKEISVNDNVWETDRIFPDGGVMPIKENLLHLLDKDGTGSYTLYYAPNDPSPPQVAAIAAVSPNPRSTPVGSIDVTFSKAIDPTTFDYHALTLTRNGGPNLITSGVTIQYIAGTQYRINGLSGLTGAEGNYVLTVSAAGIKDPIGIQGTGSASVSWVTAIQAPAVAVVTGVVAGQRNTPVPSVTVQFTKPINAATVDYHALSLTRNGGANLITGAVTVTQLDASTFRFDGLTGLTATTGHYVLVVDASQVKDATGVTGVGAVTIAWDLNTASPTVTAITAPSGSVNVPVDTIDVTFSEAIDPTTFTTAALSLTRNGGANLITPAVTIQQFSATQYRITGLTGLTNVQGTYVFAVSAAAVRDPAGNPGSGSASSTWTLTTTAPAAATNIVLTPHFGTPPNDNITNTLTPTLSGQLGAAGLTVGLFDVTANRDLGQATVTGTSFSKALSFTTAGNHQVRIRVSNAAGNYTDSLYTVVIDVTPPAITGLVNVPSGTTAQSVASIDVVFSKPIQASTFDLSHLSLTLNGGPNLITGTSGVTVTLVSGSTYRIGGLANLTRAKGTYLLTINVAGTQDLYGNVASGTTTAGWTNALAAGTLVVRPVEGTTFNGTVATLSDGDANTQAGDYTVQINWGDGTTTTGTVQATTPDHFNLQGSHRYAEEGSYAVTVTVSDRANNTATAASTAAVDDAALTATPAPVSATEGAAFSGLVATFTDAGGSEPEANYSATIDWGDGTAATTGTVRLAGDHFAVGGSHTYAEDGSFAIKVTIHEEGGANVTATVPATVADAALHAAAVDQSAVEGQGLNNVLVTTFTDDNPAGTLADYTATIDWGDHSTATTGTISLNSQTHRFEVHASHTYADDGTFTISVALRDMGGASTTATSTARISDPAVLGTGNFSLSAVEGTDSGMQTVATFTDPAGPEAVGDYTAVIAWGDTSTSNGVISYDMTSHVFTVKASHTYAEEGAFTLTVTLKHDAAPDATVTDHATVSDAAVVGTGGFSVTAVEGTDSGMQTVATFTDPAGPEALTDYSATIAWGDGTTASSGVISYDATSHTFTVKSSHAYAEEGGATIIVTLKHDAAPDATATSHVTVADAAVVPATATVTAVEGSDSGVQTLATFTDPGGAEALTDYTATVLWGDGASGTGTISYDAASHVFTVQGSHTYTEEGSYNVAVTIKHDAAPDATVTSHATVTDAAVVGTGGFSVTAVEGADSGVQTVATFTDPAGAEALTDYSATIDWGDGTTADAGTISYDATSHTFTVQGSHTYAEEGGATITVTLTHDAAPDATVTSQASVSDAAVAATGGFSVAAVEGSDSGLQTVATFTDPAGPEALADYAATIDWGDGTTADAGVITYDAASQVFTVQGSHTYAEEGGYSITVTLTHDTAPSATATSTATVADAALHARGKAVHAVEGTALERTLLATFTDDDPNATAGLFTATVDWGDGSSGPAKVRRTDKRGVFQVLGGHTYASAGSYTVTVDVTDQGGSTAEVTSTATVAGAGDRPGGASSAGQAAAPRHGLGTDDPAAAAWELTTEAHRRRLADALFSGDDWRASS